MTYKIEFLEKDVAEIKAILSIFTDLVKYKGLFEWLDSITLEITDESGDEQILDNVEDLLNLLSEDNINYVIYVPCDACDGEGTYETFNCVDSSNECCGGCFDEYQCEICGGDGQELFKSTFSFTQI